MQGLYSMARYINRSRAAVICFGGWGLQTLLHLWPRIRFIQEERRILGIDQEFPDLTKQTAFACVVPHPLLENGDKPLSVVTPDTSSPPDLYYVEKKLREPRANYGDPSHNLTSAEVWAARLFEHAKKDRLLRELTVTPPFGYEAPTSGRLWRQDLFVAGIAWAEAVVRSLLRHAIEPTRLDAVQTLDPFVQTNIYVVASLAEPTTSALIWPIVSELAVALGTRNIARIVAFFSTGSFALDDTASVEEAACYAALRELEALTGISRFDQRRLEKAVSYKSGWSDRVGDPLFDRIYLLDREKTNASLARDSHELAVLAGNVIEAFLTADGATYVERCLGPDIHADSLQRRYSLVGAANDYVPLADYIEAVIRDEQKRIVRSLVVPQEGTEEVSTNLAELKAEKEKAVRDLMRSGVMRMFVSETALSAQRRRWRSRLAALLGRRSQPRSHRSDLPSWFPELRIARSYLLPGSVRDRLRRQRTPWQWRLEFNSHATALAENIEPELRTRGFAQAWGLPHHYSSSLAAAERLMRRLEDTTNESAIPQGLLQDVTERQKQLANELSNCSLRTWAMRWRSDQRLIPHAMLEALRLAVKDICTSPDGILRASARLKAWIDECETIVEEMGEGADDPDDSEWTEGYRDRVEAFEQHFANVAGNYPQRAAIWARSLLTGFFLGFVLYSWVLFELGLSLTRWQLLLLGVICAAGTAALAVLAEGWAQWRLWRLKQERIQMAQDQLSRHAQHFVRTNLHAVYRRLAEVLGDLQSEIDSTIRSLRTWAKSEEKVHVLPLGVERSHLRVAHLNDEIWERVKSYVQSERSPVEGATAENLFRRSWISDGRLDRLWYEAGQDTGDRLAQRVRLALELPFNRRERQEHLVDVEVLRRSIEVRLQAEIGTSRGDTTRPRQSRDTIEKDLEESKWCPFRDGAHCTACSTPGDCQLFARDETDNLEGDVPLTGSLCSLYMEYLREATDYLHPSGAIFPGGSRETIRQLIDEFAIEKLITGVGSSPVVKETVERGRDFVDSSIARAKPAGYYDLANPFDDFLVDIEFGVTPEGDKSLLEPHFRSRRITLLPSRDPTAITTVRTLNWLSLSDLLFVERCRTELIRLDDSDRKKLYLMTDTLDTDLTRQLYDLPKSVEQAKYARYSPILG